MFILHNDLIYLRNNTVLYYIHKLLVTGSFNIALCNVHTTRTTRTYFRLQYRANKQEVEIIINIKDWEVGEDSAVHNNISRFTIFCSSKGIYPLWARRRDLPVALPVQLWVLISREKERNERRKAGKKRSCWTSSRGGRTKRHWRPSMRWENNNKVEMSEPVHKLLRSLLMVWGPEATSVKRGPVWPGFDCCLSLSLSHPFSLSPSHSISLLRTSLGLGPGRRRSGPTRSRRLFSLSLGRLISVLNGRPEMFPFHTKSLDSWEPERRTKRVRRTQRIYVDGRYSLWLATRRGSTDRYPLLFKRIRIERRLNTSCISRVFTFETAQASLQ